MRYTLFCLVLIGLSAAADVYSVLNLPPAQANYVSTQKDIENVNAALETMRGQYKTVRSNAYTNDYLRHPAARPVPHSADVINKIAHNMKKLRKDMLKTEEKPEGSSPEEMMLFQQLLSGLKRTSRKAGAEPAMHEASQLEMDSIQNLADQIHLVSNTLESPEENALHEHAHAQSRMLHRMTHVLDSMSDEMDSERKRHYEDMLGTLMHQHLADPDYRDTLNDHLLAHHLAREHADDEFVDHVSHHMLYNNLNQRVSPDASYGASLGAVLNSQLAGRSNNAASLNTREIGQYVDAYHKKDQASAAMFNQALAAHTNNQYAVPQQQPKPAKPVVTQQALQQRVPAPAPIPAPTPVPTQPLTKPGAK